MKIADNWLYVYCLYTYSSFSYKFSYLNIGQPLKITQNFLKFLRMELVHLVSAVHKKIHCLWATFTFPSELRSFQIAFNATKKRDLSLMQTYMLDALLKLHNSCCEELLHMKCMICCCTPLYVWRILNFRNFTCTLDVTHVGSWYMLGFYVIFDAYDILLLLFHVYLYYACSLLPSHIMQF